MISFCSNPPESLKRWFVARCGGSRSRLRGRPSRPASRLHTRTCSPSRCAPSSKNRSWASLPRWSDRIPLRHRQLLQGRLAQVLPDRAAWLTCPSAPWHFYCAISRATERASAPSQSLKPRASCPSKWNPMGPPFTSRNGWHTAWFQMPHLPLNTSIMNVRSGKRDGT